MSKTQKEMELVMSTATSSQGDIIANNEENDMAVTIDGMNKNNEMELMKSRLTEMKEKIDELVLFKTKIENMKSLNLNNDNNNNMGSVTLSKDIFAAYVGHLHNNQLHKLTMRQHVIYWLVMILTMVIQAGLIFVLLRGTITTLPSAMYDEYSISYDSDNNAYAHFIFENENGNGNSTSNYDSVDGYLSILSSMNANLSPLFDTGFDARIARLFSLLFLFAVLINQYLETDYKMFKVIAYLHDEKSMTQLFFYLLATYYMFSNVYTSLVAALIVIGAEDGMDAIFNCVQVIFILEIDNWMYNIFKQIYQPIEDQYLIIKYNDQLDDKKQGKKKCFCGRYCKYIIMINWAYEVVFAILFLAVALAGSTIY